MNFTIQKNTIIIK